MKTPKPVRKEAKKIKLALNKVDKSIPALKEMGKHKPKEDRKDFAKFAAEVRLASKGKPKVSKTGKPKVK